MSLETVVRKSIDVAGRRYSSSVISDATGSRNRKEAIGAASIAVVVSSSSVTSTAHPFSDGDIVDIYWSGGVRYDNTVASSTTDGFDITGGSGDSMPAALTDLTICEQVELNMDFDGDKVQYIVISCLAKCVVQFVTVGDVFSYVVNAGELYLFLIEEENSISGTNPLAGESIESVLVSQGDAVNRRVTILVGLT